MSMTDKEIALELTKSYLEHLSQRANSSNVSKSHATEESIIHNYNAFYSMLQDLKD
ncbi:TPA: hypothetical protein ACGOSC_000003 [Streptococcus suis]